MREFQKMAVVIHGLVTKIAWDKILTVSNLGRSVHNVTATTTYIY